MRKWRCRGGKKGEKMDKREMIELMIQERLASYFKENDGPGKERFNKSNEFLTLLNEKAPDLVEEFKNYLDWIAAHGGDEQEGIYLFGLHDGIRLMKDVICVK